MYVLDDPKQMAFALSTSDKPRGLLRLSIHRNFLQNCIRDHLHHLHSYVGSDLDLGFDIDSAGLTSTTHTELSEVRRT